MKENFEEHVKGRAIEKDPRNDFHTHNETSFQRRCPVKLQVQENFHSNENLEGQLLKHRVFVLSKAIASCDENWGRRVQEMNFWRHEEGTWRSHHTLEHFSAPQMETQWTNR